MRTFQTNSLAATKQLLNDFGIDYDNDSLKTDLLGHPDYPSLYAVHHTLGKYGLENTPAEADIDYLNNIRPPFLAYMLIHGTGSDFAVINKVHNDGISYTNGRGRKETISQQEFSDRWKNVIVTINDTVEKPAIAKKQTTIGWKLSLILLLLIATFTIAVINAASPLILAPWLLLKTSGLATTVLLLIYEIDRKNETVKQFCSTTAKVNCEAVLQSSGARIGAFSWSEIGFSYFGGSFLYLLATGGSTGAYLPLAVVSIAALPYTFYSIYYQYKIVKQWCKMCLVIQSVIVLEGTLALTALATGNISFTLASINWQMVLLLMVLLPLPLLLWLSLKPFLQNAMQFDDYQFAYLRMLNNPEIFNLMLQKQDAAPDGYESCSLLIGNPNAQHQIIKVCNPYCKPCATAHPLLEEVVAENKNVNLRILFVTGGNKAELKQKVAKQLISLYHTKGEKVAQEAMHYWYGSDRDADKFIERFPVTEHKDADHILQQMDKWQKAANISYTPTIYVNGYILPQDYTIANLKQIL